MTNIYNFSKNVFLDIKQENKNNPVFIFVILILITIPLALILNSVLIGLMAIFTFFYFKKINFKIDKELFLAIILYLLMLLTIFWTIDSDRTASAIIKEIPLLIIPICFLCFKPFTETQKNKIIQYYSYGIFLLTLFYLLKATVRFFISNNNEVFFYHELVTKEVNAIHVSVYVAIAFFYFFTKPIKKILDFVILAILFLMVFLLSSKNIIVVFLGLIVIYHLFYSKLSHQLRLKNLILVGIILISFTFIGKIKDRFKQEYETIMTDSTVNDVISKNNEIVYNVSIKQAWTNTIFRANDYFPGTAFRVYQFRIFLEMMKENNIFWQGFGLNASYKKIEEKGIYYHLYLGDATNNNQGYQTKNFHNQYVQNFAELGFFGFLILITMLFINLKNALKNKNFIHISFAILMISLFLTETFLWRQRGVVFFTMMYCLMNANSQKSEF